MASTDPNGFGKPILRILSKDSFGQKLLFELMRALIDRFCNQIRFEILKKYRIFHFFLIFDGLKLFKKIRFLESAS